MDQPQSQPNSGENQNPLLQFDPFNYQQFAETLLWLRDEDRQVSPFVFNRAQQKYWEEKSNRDIILKARKLGFSTFKLGEYFHETITCPNTSFVVISHETLATRRLLRIIKFFYEKLPDQIKPKIEYNSAYEMTFPDFGSHIYVGTAGAKSFGRGDTINLLHCSEVAFWPDAEITMLGLREAVPRNGKITLESTPNGMGGYFYEEWQKAKQGVGRYRPHFYSWWNADKYSIDQIVIEDIAPLTKEEYLLVENQGLTPGQILWRREKIGDVGENNFKQEYPENDIDCFLSNTRRVFSSDNVEFQKRFITPPKRTELTVRGVEEISTGALRIWKDPSYGRRYVIGADVAEGIRTGDYSCAAVLDIETMEQVASLHLHTDPDLFGIYVARLGKHYNNAKVAVEANGCGLVTLNTLLNGSLSHQVVPYKNLYSRPTLDEDNALSLTKLGWRTTKNSKPVLINTFASALRQKEIIIHEKELLDELCTYVMHEDGGMGAVTGTFDDRIIAICLALQVRLTIGIVTEDADYEPAFVGDRVTGY